MKKILLTTVVALLSMIVATGAPARITLAPNQMIMGHYNTDSVNVGGGLGMSAFTGTRPIGTILEPSELTPFQGGKIVAFRVGLAESTPVSRVFVAPVVNGEVGEQTSWSCDVSDAGWNEVWIETPYEINLDDDVSLLIGFDYEQTKTNKPVSYVMVGDIYPSIAYLTYRGTTGWMDINLTSYGNLCLQCVVESDYFDDVQLLLDDLQAEKIATKTAGTLPFTFMSKNQGTTTLAAGEYTFDYSVDGEYKGTITPDVELGSVWQQYEASCRSTTWSLAPTR